MEFGDDIMHLNIFQAMRHPTYDHSIFLVDIIDDVVDSVYIYIDLFSDFSYFYDFDLCSFDYACDDYDESATLYSICVEISSTIHFDYDVGAGSDPPISLPPAVNLSLPSTIQHPSWS